ncbi:class I SAM-dependent methyltransferase [Candidatus Poribacteria bacterium]|nr:class I SAM-dependent methyltransferase [Candidatus Poribacteria bacterium]
MSSGPIVRHVIAALSSYEVFRDYRSGRIPYEDYLNWLEANAEDLERAVGGRRTLRFLASRYPPDFEANAEAIFEDLLREGFIQDRPDRNKFKRFRSSMEELFDHDGLRTYIHPDEAQLAYMLSMAVKPKRMVAMGSYYGYWAIWALPGVSEGRGEALLIDPNPGVCDLAERNLKRLGYDKIAAVIRDKAENVIPDLPADVDLAMLDADGDHSYPSIYRGKGIYALLAELIAPRMKEGGLLIVHNDYLPEVGANRLSKPFLEPLCSRIELFHEVCRRHFSRGYVAPTPDGFGVYRR